MGRRDMPPTPRDRGASERAVLLAYSAVRERRAER